MEKIKALFEKYREIIVYIIFGVLTTAVNWAVYMLMVKLLGVDLSSIDKNESLLSFFSGNRDAVAVTVCNAVAWVAGVLFAFVTNKIWVFRSMSKKAATVLREFFSFVGARAITGLMEIFLPTLLISLGLNQTILGVEGAAAKAVVSVAVVILNYVFSKLIVFRKKKEEKEPENAE